MPEKKLYDLFRKFVEGQAEIENGLHTCLPRIALIEETLALSGTFSKLLLFTASCWKKQTVHIGRKKSNFQLEKYFLLHDNDHPHANNMTRGK